MNKIHLTPPTALLNADKPPAASLRSLRTKSTDSLHRVRTVESHCKTGFRFDGALCFAQCVHNSREKFWRQDDRKGRRLAGAGFKEFSDHLHNALCAQFAIVRISELQLWSCTSSERFVFVSCGAGFVAIVVALPRSCEGKAWWLGRMSGMWRVYVVECDCGRRWFIWWERLDFWQMSGVNKFSSQSGILPLWKWLGHDVARYKNILVNFKGNFVLSL